MFVQPIARRVQNRMNQSDLEAYQVTTSQQYQSERDSLTSVTNLKLSVPELQDFFYRNSRVINKKR